MKVKYFTIALFLNMIQLESSCAIKIKTHSHDPDEDKALAAIGAAINAET